MATVAGVSFRSWQDYEAGKTVPNGRVYAKLCALGFRAAWLLGSDPPMMEARRDVQGRLVSRQDADDDDLVALPRYDVRAAAGLGEIVQSERIRDWIYFRREWLRRELGVNPSRIVIVSAVGDSMAPTIESGDLLLVDTNQQHFAGDGVYVLSIEDSVVVKRLARRSGGELSVSSDNPLYRHTSEEVSRADARLLRFVGRVVWSGGKI